jgi:hypothetical protein
MAAGSADPRFWGLRLSLGPQQEPRTAKPAVRATEDLWQSAFH